MLTFLGFLALNSAISRFLAGSQYWLYPLQTALCGVLLVWFRGQYDLARICKWPVVISVGLLAFAVWIAPQVFVHAAPRRLGFNPDRFIGSPALYWATVVMRFLRLVVVVPLVEEIFWRGFLLRYLIDERFTKVPFGTFRWLSFAGVTIAFTLAHAIVDWPAAVVTGMLFNFVAYQTRSLASCVLAHATTNLLLGLWIMQTKQWGFW